jgi:ketosteroid isomerase-like protein
VRDLILTVHKAIELGDHDTLDSCLHDDVTYRRPGSPVISGREAVIDWYRRKRTALTSTIHIDELVVEGDRAVAMGMVEGRARDGSPIHERFADAYRFQDGLVRDRTTYFFRHGF